MQEHKLPRHIALIPAAGVGARMQAGQPKQYMPVAGKPMMQHVLETFASSPDIDHTYVIVSEEDAYIDDLMAALPYGQDKTSVIRHGGATRQETVMNGLAALSDTVDKDDWILVHDAARPGLTHALIRRLVTALANEPAGGLLALPIVDTLKQSSDGYATKTIPRNGLWAAQTPQMFRFSLLKQAMLAAHAHLQDITDDASAMEMAGFTPRLIEGAPRNFKVTHPQDVVLAEFFLQQHQE